MNTDKVIQDVDVFYQALEEGFSSADALALCSTPIPETTDASVASELDNEEVTVVSDSSEIEARRAERRAERNNAIRCAFTHCVPDVRAGYRRNRDGTTYRSQFYSCTDANRDEYWDRVSKLDRRLLQAAHRRLVRRFSLTAEQREVSRQRRRESERLRVARLRAEAKERDALALARAEGLLDAEAKLATTLAEAKAEGVGDVVTTSGAGW